MKCNIFSIRAIKTEKKFLRSLPAYTVARYAVEYRGVEINRFSTLDAAEMCVEDGIAVPADAQWAYEDALRNAGYDIPK